MKSSTFIFLSALMLELWESVFNMMMANAMRKIVSSVRKFFIWSGLHVQ